MYQYIEFEIKDNKIVGMKNLGSTMPNKKTLKGNSDKAKSPSDIKYGALTAELRVNSVKISTEASYALGLEKDGKVVIQSVVENGKTKVIISNSALMGRHSFKTYKFTASNTFRYNNDIISALFDLGMKKGDTVFLHMSKHNNYDVLEFSKTVQEKPAEALKNVTKINKGIEPGEYITFTGESKKEPNNTGDINSILTVGSSEDEDPLNLRN